MNIAVKLLLSALILTCFSCQQSVRKTEDKVFTSDVDLFWQVFDKVVAENDTSVQIRLLDSLYIGQGSIGLQEIIEARNYTARQYVELINKHPAFWQSVRSNTLQAKYVAKELNDGIKKLQNIYPDLRPAHIYFTIGAMRTNGTTKDSLVLIGSELAMADSSTRISEFEESTEEWLSAFFATNPLHNIVLLNIHEYVHTQQKPIPTNLLYQVLYEGIAEFVSVKAMGVPSNTPAIAFGKKHPAVRQKFEQEMFNNKTYEWMWSNAPNDFEIRDLGYYIGYEIAERYYNQATNKRKAIKELIELDYDRPSQVDLLIDESRFFSKSINELRREFA